MSPGFDDLWNLVRQTLRDPRAGLREVLRQDPPPAARIQMVVLLAVLSAILVHASLWVAPPPPGNLLVTLLFSSPFASAVTQVAALLLMALAVYGLGRAWGGTGQLGDAVLAVAWLQVILVGMQAAQVLALVALPPLASIISPVSIILFFWLLTQFVTELHGFASASRVFLGILAAFLALSFLLAALFAAIFGPEGMTNV